MCTRCFRDVPLVSSCVCGGLLCGECADEKVCHFHLIEDHLVSFVQDNCHLTAHGILEKFINRRKFWLYDNIWVTVSGNLISLYGSNDNFIRFECLNDAKSKSPYVKKISSIANDINAMYIVCLHELRALQLTHTD